MSTALPPASRSDNSASYWFWGVLMSHSFGGFHDAVNAARPSFRSRPVNVGPVNSAT